MDRGEKIVVISVVVFALLFVGGAMLRDGEKRSDCLDNGGSISDGHGYMGRGWVCVYKGTR
jgi:hypothetical protein